PPDVLRGGWRAGPLAEWGLRFWIILVLRLDPKGDGNLIDWHFDPEAGTVSTKIDGKTVTVSGDAPPLMVTFHDSIDALSAELKQYGYFYLESRGTSGKVAALRYNL